MRYEFQPNGDLRITIQPGHRLWKIFRQAREASLNYNLRRRGDEPVNVVMEQLFPDSTPESRSGLLMYIPTYPNKIPPLMETSFKVWKTKADMYATGQLIREYLTQKLFLAHSKLVTKKDELSSAHYSTWRSITEGLSQEEADQLPDDEFDRASERQKKVTGKIGSILGQILNGVEGLSPPHCTILFEGTEGIEPYLFDARVEMSHIHYL